MIILNQNLLLLAKLILILLLHQPRLWCLYRNLLGLLGYSVSLVQSRIVDEIVLYILGLLLLYLIYLWRQHLHIIYIDVFLTRQLLFLVLIDLIWGLSSLFAAHVLYF